MSDATYAMPTDERPMPAAIFADAPDAAGAAQAALAATDVEVRETLPLDALEQRLSILAAPRTILVDFTSKAADVERTVASVESFAETMGSQAFVSAPLPLLDRLDAAISSDRVTLLCQPSLADRITALIAALDRGTRVAEKAAELDSLRLRRLADEVNRIARALTSLSVNGDDLGGRDHLERDADRPGISDVKLGFAAEPSQTIMPPAGEVRAILRLRRLRESFFDPDLFADPAWDMLLDLLAAKIEGDQVAVSSLCIAAAVPPTTALRWIKTMTDAKLLERHADPMDGRRIFIRLTENAANALGRYFAAARRQGSMLI